MVALIKMRSNGSFEHHSITVIEGPAIYRTKKKSDSFLKLMADCLPLE